MSIAHKGVKHTLETRQKMSAHIKSEQHRKRLSIAQTGKKQTPETIAKMKTFQKGHVSWLKGKKHSEKTCKKISLNGIGRTHKGNKDFRHTEEAKQKIRESLISGIRFIPTKFKDTSIELAMESELTSRGVLFLKQTPLCKIAVVDFYLPEYQIVIECDGCFFHGCELHGSLKYHQDSIARDKKKNEILSLNGFRVFRFWEHEIKNSVEECVNSIFSDINL